MTGSSCGKARERTWEGGGALLRPLLVVVVTLITASFVTAQENADFSLAGGKFGEINLRFGYDFAGDVVGYGGFELMGMDFTKREFQPMTPGVSAGLEYLFPIPFGNSGAVLYPGFLKLGAGVQYLFTRHSFAVDPADPGSQDDDDNLIATIGEYEDFSFLPIYAIVQLNPAKALPGLYFRGTIGYSLLLQQSKAEELNCDKKNGLHWGLAAGYETAWGFFFEYAYTETSSTIGFIKDLQFPGQPAYDVDLVYYKSSLSIGYKIRL